MKTIEIGALSPKLSEQLKGMMSRHDALILDHDNTAITRCILHGYMSDQQGRQARSRLAKKCSDAVSRFTGTKTKSVEKSYTTKK